MLGTIQAYQFIHQLQGLGRELGDRPPVQALELTVDGRLGVLDGGVQDGRVSRQEGVEVEGGSSGTTVGRVSFIFTALLLLFLLLEVHGPPAGVDGVLAISVVRRIAGSTAGGDDRIQSGGTFPLARVEVVALRGSGHVGG